MICLSPYSLVNAKISLYFFKFFSDLKNVPFKLKMNELFNYEIEILDRINILNSYPEPYDFVKRISGMYEFSGTSTLQQYLIFIVKSSTISSIIKSDAVKSLFSFQEFQETIRDSDSEDMKAIKKESNENIQRKNEIRIKKAYDALNHLCCHFDGIIATPYKIDMIHMLMRNPDFFSEANDAFTKIISDSSISYDYRYKTILSLEKRSDIDHKEKYAVSLLSSFINNSKNPTTYRILASQNLLQNFIISVTQRQICEDLLITFARDSELDYNIRADSCDTLINLGVDTELKEEANSVLMTLGAMFGVVKTVYDDAQNVHNKNIETTSLPIIRFLLQIDSKNADYTTIILEINKELKLHNKIKNDKIQLSLNRIAIDRSLYHNTSLTTILTKIWFYINTHEENRDELVKRLFEELEEMAGTCSSGFIMRLLNTLSGFEEELTLKISYEDQIVANFIGRLNAYTKKITEKESPFFNERLHDVVKLYLDKENIDYNNNLEEYVKKLSEKEKEDIVSDFSDNVLFEMCENTSNWSKRLDFSLFFRTHLSHLREELYSEFKSFVTDSEFDLFIRKAISTYEGVKFMA